MAGKHRAAQTLFEELRNERWTVVDAVFWFLMGVLTCILIQMIR